VASNEMVNNAVKIKYYQSVQTMLQIADILEGQKKFKDAPHNN
jgi:hypothetical protein